VLQNSVTSWCTVLFGTSLSGYTLLSTAKPRFGVPTFSEFPYLVNIFSGPGQSPI
jgi:hypothetical protein